MSYLDPPPKLVPPPTDDDLINHLLEQCAEIESKTGQAPNCIQLGMKGVLSSTARKKLETMGYRVAEGPDEGARLWGRIRHEPRPKQL